MLIEWWQRMHPISVEQILLLHRLQMLVAWKDAFLENYLAILAEQKRYLSVWLRASNERYFSFNWRLVIIKHEKLFAAKFCPETNARFINCSQLLPTRPLITHWDWKLICSSVHFLYSFFHSRWGAIRTKKWCFLLNKRTEPNEGMSFEFRLGKHWIWIVRESTSVSIIFKTRTIQSSRLVNLNVCLRGSLYEVRKPQGTEESYLTVFPVEFTVQL